MFKFFFTVEAAVCTIRRLLETTCDGFVQLPYGHERKPERGAFAFDFWSFGCLVLEM